MTEFAKIQAIERLLLSGVVFTYGDLYRSTESAGVEAGIVSRVISRLREDGKIEILASGRTPVIRARRVVS